MPPLAPSLGSDLDEAGGKEEKTEEEEGEVEEHLRLPACQPEQGRATSQPAGPGG